MNAVDRAAAVEAEAAPCTAAAVDRAAAISAAGNEEVGLDAVCSTAGADSSRMDGGAETAAVLGDDMCGTRVAAVIEGAEASQV